MLAVTLEVGVELDVVVCAIADTTMQAIATRRTELNLQVLAYRPIMIRFIMKELRRACVRTRARIVAVRVKHASNHFHAVSLFVFFCFSFFVFSYC